MALKIRLSRGGTKKRPHYSIVVAESRSPRDGRFIDRHRLLQSAAAERSRGSTLKLDLDAAKAWLAKGATATDRVHRFLANAGVVKPLTHHNPQKMKPKKKAQERAAAAAKAAGTQTAA